jgi:hypothetical protein
MLIILLPSWAAWALALLVVVSWMGTWALCRAAALGDEAMFRALESPAQAEVADEADLETCLATVRLEACLTWEADFLYDPPVSDEEGQLAGSST